MHSLQLENNLGWDDILDKSKLNEWKNISKQANNAPVIKIKRCLGERDDDYRLISFCDSSKLIFGTVIFIQNPKTKEVNFVMSKNKIINKQLESKSIPVLELQGITLAVESLVELFDEISGNSFINKIMIKEMIVFSDSIIALYWLNSY